MSTGAEPHGGSCRQALKALLALAAMGLGLLAQATHAAGYWTRTGSMTTARLQPALTVRDDGSVLAAGGDITATPTSELYDPKTGTWGRSAPTNAFHSPAAMTRLQDGRYLLVDGSGQPTEIYDPKTNGWSTGPALVQPYFNGVASVPLNDGRVLAIGGNPASGMPPNIEILDAAARQWTQSTTTAISPFMGGGFPYGTLLADGRALFYTMAYGGYTALFDPASNQWSAGAPPVTGGTINLAGGIPLAAGATLGDGTVLSAGSCGGIVVSASLTTACDRSQAFDPATGQWTLTGPLPTGLDGGLMTALDGGDVLLTGGTLEFYVLGPQSTFPIGFIVAANITERWSASTRQWSYAPHIPGARQGHAAVRLANGNVLIAGGMTTALDFLPGVFLSSAAVYHP